MADETVTRADFERVNADMTAALAAINAQLAELRVARDAPNGGEERAQRKAPIRVPRVERARARVAGDSSLGEEDPVDYGRDEEEDRYDQGRQQTVQASHEDDDGEDDDPQSTPPDSDPTQYLQITALDSSKASPSQSSSPCPLSPSESSPSSIETLIPLTFVPTRTAPIPPPASNSHSLNLTISSLSVVLLHELRMP
ncbi:hypothetical protein QQ045_010026 [Rhodiola kirilowii]